MGNVEDCDPRPEWLVRATEQGNYDRIRTLPEWLSALDWRLKLKTDIEEKREAEGTGDFVYHKNLGEELSLLFNGILRKEQNQVGITTAWSGIRSPVFNHSIDDCELKNYSMDTYFRLGFIGIDFSYDKKTLMESFESFLDHHLDRVNEQYIGDNKFLTKGEKGLIHYTNSICHSWADRKVLQCIDFDLYRMCCPMDLGLKQEKIASFLDISKDQYISAKSIGVALLTPLSVARLRASDLKLIEKK